MERIGRPKLPPQVTRAVGALADGRPGPKTISKAKELIPMALNVSKALLKHKVPVGRAALAIGAAAAQIRNPLRLMAGVASVVSEVAKLSESCKGDHEFQGLLAELSKKASELREVHAAEREHLIVLSENNSQDSATNL